MNIKSITGATKSTELKRTVNPSNDNEILISFGSLLLAVSKRDWNMLTLNAPVIRVSSVREVTA